MTKPDIFYDSSPQKPTIEDLRKCCRLKKGNKKFCCINPPLLNIPLDNSSSEKQKTPTVLLNFHNNLRVLPLVICPSVTWFMGSLIECFNDSRLLEVDSVLQDCSLDLTLLCFSLLSIAQLKCFVAY